MIKHFPHPKSRPEQIKIIKKIEKSIEDGFKYILLNAGTGIGKSAIASTLAKYYNDSLIVTSTKQLQKQYQKDFKYPSMLGRGNFDCRELKKTPCDLGLCRTTPKK